MSTSSYAPEEFPIYLWTDSYTLAGAILGGVSYGELNLSDNDDVCLTSLLF